MEKADSPTAGSYYLEKTPFGICQYVHTTKKKVYLNTRDKDGRQIHVSAPTFDELKEGLGNLDREDLLEKVSKLVLGKVLKVSEHVSITITK